MSFLESLVGCLFRVITAFVIIAGGFMSLLFGGFIGLLLYIIIVILLTHSAEKQK